MLSATAALAQTAPGPIPPVSSAPAPVPASSDTGSATGTSPEAPIADVVVTANRRAERAREVAGSVTAISGEDLTRRQQVRIQDLQGTVPGLGLEEIDKTSVRIVLRGLNSGSAGATVGSVVDDVPINSASSLNNGALVSPNPDTYDLQRIEVLRGPQGTLYGATAEGGLIKYVTNPPDLRTYSGSIEGGLSGLTDGGLGGTTRAYVNIPVVQGKVAVRLSGTNEYLPGYIRNFTNGKTNTNSGQQTSWRAQVLAKPDDRLAVRLFASRQTIFSNAGNQLEVQGASANPLQTSGQLNLLNPLQRNARLPTNSQLETSLFYGQVDYNLGFATLTSSSSYGYNKLQFNQDLSDFNAAPGRPYSVALGQAIYGTPAVVGARQNEDTRKFNQEVRLSSNPGQQLAGYGFDWQAGVYYTRETNQLIQGADARNPNPPLNLLPGPVLGGDQFKSAYNEWAAFGQFTFHFTPTVSIDVGGRYAGNTQSSAFRTLGGAAFGPSGVAPQINSNDHVGIYNVAPKWQFDNDTLLYARVATGYRPGGPNLPFPGVTGIPTSYTSDSTLNYEAGVRRDFFNKKVQVDLTGFYVDWSQVQVVSIFNSSAGLVGTVGNAGSAVSKGFEWSFNWSVLPGLKVGVTGAYTDARLSAPAPGLGGRNGDYLPFVPNVTNNFNVDYFWEPINNVQAFVSGSATYVGERYGNFTTAAATNNHTLLPGYVTGGIRAGLEYGHYSAEAFINNISDAHGVTTYFNSGGTRQTGLVTINQPRLIGAVLRAKF